MRIGIITPSPARSRHGNRITALRWQHILRSLGHRVTLAQSYAGETYDLMIALHARRSYSSIRSFHAQYPSAPLVVALTGTDIYHDLPGSRAAQKSLELATRLIVLQPLALLELRPELRQKARVIYQSVEASYFARHTRSTSSRAGRSFDVCVAGHLRAVKDPFRAALAARLLPMNSRVRIVHLGSAMHQAFAKRARREMKINPRYHWLGERPRGFVLRILRHSELFVLSSRLEGGANALSEALAAGVPVLASRISGSEGILGRDYPGYFEVGDTRALARLLSRAETHAVFLTELGTRCKTLSSLFSPQRERAAWTNLLNELGFQAEIGVPPCPSRVSV